MTSPEQQRETLPTNVRPKDYTLSTRLDLAQGLFSGSVQIVVDVREETDKITLNAAELELSEANIVQGDATVQGILIELDKEREQATIHFERPLTVGSASLMIRFAGKLSTGMTGFYLSTYEVDGAKKRAAVTQFEAPHARKAFPCWDQPDCKATFTIALDVAEGLTAISNGDMRSETSMPGGRKIVQFETTPRMSTYIVAFFIGEFEYVEKIAKTGTRLRVYTTAGKKEQGLFALELTDQILTYATDYFGVEYPLPKLDQIAVPDFAFGAMENWGAICYREMALLLTADSSMARKQQVAQTVSHELAHMWFGNLVTMTWWDDLWLNESFATWFGNKTVDALHPEFDVWPQFVTEDYGAGFELDGLDSTHAIHVPVDRAQNIDEIFDAISYNKGGSVLRMLEAFLRENVEKADTFRAGVCLYMQRHAYSNTAANDLWAALEEASSKPIREIMHCWTQEPGHPVLCVHAGHAVADKRRPVVIQQRFSYGDICGTNKGCKTVWEIPMVAKTDLGTHSVFLTTKNSVIELPSEITDGSSFLHLNADRTGFYRVHYDEASMAELLKAIANGQLTTTERLGIEDDANALCRAGYISVAQYLTVASAFAGETEFAVWSNLLSHLGGMRLLFDNDLQSVWTLKLFGRALVGGIVAQLGWEPRPGETPSQAMLRPLVLGFAGRCGDDAVNEEAHARFDLALAGHEEIVTDLRGMVYALIAETGHPNRYKHLHNLYRKSDAVEQKVHVLQAIGRFSLYSLRQKALEWSLTDEVRAQDAMRVVASVAVASGADTHAWEFVTKRWQDIANRHLGNPNLLGRYITCASEHLSGRNAAAEIREFFEATKPVGLDRLMEQSVEKVTHNAAWRAANSTALLQWNRSTSTLLTEA